MSSPPDDEPLPRVFVEAWQDLPVDAGQVQRAYLRFLQEQRPAPLHATARQVSRWIVIGAALGSGTLYAATGPLQLLGRSADVVVTSVPRPVPTAPRERFLAPPLSPIAESSAVVDPQPPLPSTSRAIVSPAPAASTSEQWQRAARGLRDRDFTTADAALAELAQRGTSAERESAQLVQAQLLLSQGRDGDAANLLRRLRATAHSPVIRQKSAELLARTNETLPSRRSFAPTEGTNDP